ncbi:hypothetical protein MPSEU_000947000 [Mayamaea pseudoterrestris]|nr:hypothetical protein MPSEU_000947000 [Mayamaea pseudoterrestris]
MSDGYAARLKHYPDKGVCGLPENFDSSRVLTLKMNALAEMMDTSRSQPKRIVILTGAGISTAAGIPDFRGPNGIWTLEKQQSKASKRKRNEALTTDTAPPPPSIDFTQAKPTLTHQAITRLILDGKVQFCLTQNVDGLHQRSGLPRNKLAVLHGCAFTERCEDCLTELFRDDEVKGMSFKKTGNKCPNCGGFMRDTLLDWEDELPVADWERAQDECERADLVVCLGTSLRIQPAGDLPTLANKFIIVNLQMTEYDDKATLLVRAKVDGVMEMLMKRLGYQAGWENDLLPEIQRTWTPSAAFVNDNA